MPAAFSIFKLFNDSDIPITSSRPEPSYIAVQKPFRMTDVHGWDVVICDSEPEADGREDSQRRLDLQAGHVKAVINRFPC